MHFAAVVSFAAGLLLGGCIIVFGLRGSLFRRDTLLRQSSYERPATLSANTPGVRPPATRPSGSSGDPPASRGSHPPIPSPPSPSPQIRQDPSGLRSCTTRSCLGSRTAGGDISQIHRSVILLATGGERLPVFHGPGFFPLYIVTEDKDAQTLFEGGANSLLYGLDRFQDLPFVDFASDIVVLDVSSFPKTLLGGVVTEAVRILAQQGVLFVLGAAEFDISDFSPQAAKLVLAGFYAHSFVRRMGVVPDLPICKDCGMADFLGNRAIELSPENQCQAWVKPDFKSIFQPDIAKRFKPKAAESFENQRLIHWYRPNVLKTKPDDKKGQWSDKYARTNSKQYKAAYVNPDPFKMPPRLDDKVRSGKYKRILDAGAGTCSLEGELRRKGYFKTVHNFLAFGAYDCSMLRICAERGSISFQHNWLKPLPVCASCKFDLIYQWAGVHHMHTVEEHDGFISGMLALLECGGLLFVNDIGEWRPAFRKVLKIKREQKVARHDENKDGAFEIYRTC